MYERLPDKDEPDAFGLSRKDYGHETYEVWPENWPAFDLFHKLQTQWRAAAMGFTGLDHDILFRRLDRMNLSVDEWDALDSDVRVMELQALETMNQKQE